MDETEDLLTVANPDEVSEEYNRLYAIYESISSNSDAVENLTQALEIDNTDSTVAKFKAWDLFNIRGRQRTYSNIYAMPNFFDDDAERKARELLINSLNSYIRRLETVRSSYNKLATFFSYLMYSGLYGIIADIYVPEEIKPVVDQIIESINAHLNELLEGVQEYFARKNNEKLNQIIISLGTHMLAQRSDQVFRTLIKYDDTLTEEEDLEYLRECREDYLKYQNNPQLSYAKQSFGLSDGTYYRNLYQIVNDLCTLLDEDSIELLTNLFLKN